MLILGIVSIMIGGVMLLSGMSAKEKTAAVMVIIYYTIAFALILIPVIFIR